MGDTVTTTSAYNQWISSAETNEALIETIQVSHPMWGDVWLANWDRNILATLEAVPGGGVVQEFLASRFYLEPAGLTSGTEQVSNLSITSLDGLLYEYFADMTIVDREVPIEIIARSYLSASLTAPVYNTPPVWYLQSITATWDVLQGSLQSTPLRVQRIGRYYTSIEFPVFQYVR